MESCIPTGGDLCRWTEQARNGSRTAFAQIQQNLEPVVRRFVRRLIGVNEAEEDIVHEAFVALYQGLGRLREPERLKPFVLRVARNLAFNEMRRQGRFRTIPLESDEESRFPGGAAFLADTGPTPEAVVARFTAMAELRQAIDCLPEPQRQALILYAEEELSYPQIAEVMATDLNNIKARIYHARRALVRRLTPDTLSLLGVAVEPR